MSLPQTDKFKMEVAVKIAEALRANGKAISFDAINVVLDGYLPMSDSIEDVIVQSHWQVCEPPFVGGDWLIYTSHGDYVCSVNAGRKIAEYICVLQQGAWNASVAELGLQAK